MISIRDITDLPGCRAVVGVQEQVWGAESEIVPASVLIASIKRGGILIGGYRGDELVGFVWSLPGWLGSTRTHWSHMLGVVPNARGSGLGEDLKWAQRERALAQQVELIEWTFDPLQTQNAYLNLSLLGCTAGTYLVDAYGNMEGPLHRGTPTDRLIAEWWIVRPHVVRRADGRSAASPIPARSADVLQAPAIIDDDNHAAAVKTNLTDRRLLLPVPPRFGELQQQNTAAALAWRLAVREAFTTYFARGYRAVDFFRDQKDGSGAYLLASATEGLSSRF